MEGGGVRLGGPVGEIQPEDVHAGGDERVERAVAVAGRPDRRDDLRAPHVESFSIMGQVAPDAIEHYLSSLNHQADDVLKDIARSGDEQDLPLVDAEVGVLLRVLATAIRPRAFSKSAPRSATPGSGSPARCRTTACW